MSLINVNQTYKTHRHLLGQHIGIVVENSDPLGQGRVKALIEGIYETSCDPAILPWVYPSTSQAWRSDTGSFNVPPVGVALYITFANGNPYAPMYSGAAGQSGQTNIAAYGNVIQNYDGATYNQSKEPEKYDADLKTTEQGPTTPKKQHIELS